MEHNRKHLPCLYIMQNCLGVFSYNFYIYIVCVTLKLQDNNVCAVTGYYVVLSAVHPN